MSGFAGFPPELFAFFEGLAKDNSKAYWKANRASWETHVRGPIEALLADLRPEFPPAADVPPAPRSALRSGAVVVQQFEPADWMHAPEALDRIRGVWRGAQPLTDWLEAHVGPSEEPAPRRAGPR